jgi:preprotein translocase subunit YajC
MRAEQFSTWAAESGQGGGGSLWTLLLPVLLLALFYFVAIRPQRRRQREMQNLQNQIQPGQQVITTTGMYATVVAVENDAVVLEVAPGVHSRFVKQVIGRVIDPAAETPAGSAESTDSTDSTGSTGTADAADTKTEPADDKTRSTKPGDTASS